MKAYQVICQGHTSFAGSQSDAKAMRDELLEGAGINPRSKAAKEAASVEEVDIPTDKAGLLDWINNDLIPNVLELSSSQEDDEDPEEDEDEDEGEE